MVLETDTNSMSSNRASLFTRTQKDANLTLAAGAFLAVLTLVASSVLNSGLSLSSLSLIFTLFAIASAALAILYAQTPVLKQDGTIGVAIGCTAVALLEVLQSGNARVLVIAGAVLTGVAIALDRRALARHTEVHHHNHKKHDHSRSDRSRLTKFLLTRFEPDSIIHNILLEKDSRRIAYFGG